MEDRIDLSTFRARSNLLYEKIVAVLDRVQISKLLAELEKHIGTKSRTRKKT